MTTPFRIVVADDDRAIRILLSVILAKRGYEVETATDGQEALRLLALSRPDLVLLDLQMPKLNGFRTLSEIRANPSHADLPVLATSAYSDRNEEWARAVGFEYYFHKPIDRTELLRVVESFLASHFPPRAA